MREYGRSASAPVYSCRLRVYGSRRLNLLLGGSLSQAPDTSSDAGGCHDSDDPLGGVLVYGLPASWLSTGCSRVSGFQIVQHTLDSLGC